MRLSKNEKNINTKIDLNLFAELKKYSKDNNLRIYQTITLALKNFLRSEKNDNSTDKSK